MVPTTIKKKKHVMNPLPVISYYSVVIFFLTYIYFLTQNPSLNER